ncbi:phosphatidylinositol glycan anchor biosynthesis class U protein-like [Xenia sp. Carnegie-2017]|uniref:phosphatidylinositol glycan anchor biosynthesis class U protein-like n=1 Tax=Xenia sp. Carnegie-2017 TaxID=2897299 RepID=UPI001F0433B3|nr:phosphatidylinositol glycan anchor biosynthesis class U protein-like [Xenia sp. Carnegie-2017]
MVKRNLVFLIITAVVVRCLLFLFNVHDSIYDRIEFTTPLTSWKRVLEGLSLLDHGLSPYAGDSVHEPPLVLLLFYLLRNKSNGIPLYIVFMMFDILTGFLLYLAAKCHCRNLLSRQKRDLKHYSQNVAPILITLDHLENLPVLVCASYLLNPFTIASCVAQSTGLITNLSLTFSMYFAFLGSTSLAMCFVALASYKSLYCIMLVVPLTIILTKKKMDESKYHVSLVRAVISSLTFFSFWMGVYLALSRVVIGSWQFLDASYGFTLRVPDLTPNMGLFWYLFLEMFDHFREFFVLVFQLNAFFYVIPLTSLLRNDPVFLFYTLSSVIAIFKSYPALGDFSIPFALFVSWSHLYPYMKNIFFVGCMFLFSSILAPIFWHLWIYAGSANANFFYAVTLAYSSAQIFLLGDVIYAFLRRNFDLEHGITRKKVNDETMIVLLK